MIKQTIKPRLELDNVIGINNLLSKEENYVDIVYNCNKEWKNHKWVKFTLVFKTSEGDKAIKNLSFSPIG